MNSHNIKCPRCGFIGWSSEQFCRRCGCDFTSINSSFENNLVENSNKNSSSKLWMWSLLIGLFVVTALFAIWSTQEKPSEQKTELGTLTSNSDPPLKLKKPLNNNGERVEFQQYMTAGKTNIVYFYADW